MTSGQKKAVFDLLKTVSSYNAGYTTPSFSEEPAFEDDFVEVIETKPASPEVQVKTGSEKSVPEKESAPQVQVKKEAPSISQGVTLESIAAKISSCTKCLLSQKRLNTVPGEGVINPLVLVIGEGPGEDEDKTGRPFVGAAGQLLDKMLSAISLRRDLNCYIANIVKCRPPMNRTPMEDEAAACSGFLQAQIHVLKPKFILAMGRCAIQNLLKTQEGIKSLRGRFFEYNG
ncbi:MAG: uracil-DNA glycosylase, partial [Treponema sp.]|nr:uracil-DNA glycosylase [Treponema sp.]